jgi:hypothetical protein
MTRYYLLKYNFITGFILPACMMEKLLTLHKLSRFNFLPDRSGIVALSALAAFLLRAAPGVIDISAFQAFGVYLPSFSFSGLHPALLIF